MYLLKKTSSQFIKNWEIHEIKIGGGHAMNRLVIDLEKNKQFYITN